MTECNDCDIEQGTNDEAQGGGGKRGEGSEGAGLRKQNKTKQNKSNQNKTNQTNMLGLRDQAPREGKVSLQKSYF